MLFRSFNLFLILSTVFLKAQNIDLYITLLEKGKISEVKENLPELIERYPNEPGVHIWKDMEVVWAGDITPLEFMEEQQRLWDKAREDDALVPVGKR